MTSATRPFARFEWMLAGRYLRAKRAESFVSVISGFSLVGIALGVATLIIVMSVMNGFRHDLLSRILGLKGHIMIEGVQTALPDYDAIAAKVREVPGVVHVAPVVEGQVMATANGASLGVIVRGMRRDDLKVMSVVSKSLAPGTLAAFAGDDSVVIGQRLAERLRLAPGMSITLIAPRGNVTPFGVTPRIKTYRIAGTFRIGMSEYDQSYIFMPLAQAQLYFNLADAVSGLEVMTDDPDRADALAGPVSHAAGPGTRAYTWEDINSSFFGAIEVERNVMFLILSLIILVAALNIVSGLIMLVKDKSQDIAILRTMGASRGAVMRVFM
ncbi:MAG: ABC transporter permease, partial [Alphaproteobacteria bacterium]|nr:ABC transporter permease [Alphaproteobacteria bacterium]